MFVRHVLAGLAVAARRGLHQHAALVAQVDRQAVELELGAYSTGGIVRAELQLAPHARVERLRAVRPRCRSRCGSTASAPRGAPARSSRARRAAHALRRRIRRAQLGVLRFERLQLAEQPVVLGVGHRRRVEHVVVVVVALELFAAGARRSPRRRRMVTSLLHTGAARAAIPARCRRARIFVVEIGRDSSSDRWTATPASTAWPLSSTIVRVRGRARSGLRRRTSGAAVARQSGASGTSSSSVSAVLRQRRLTVERNSSGVPVSSQPAPACRATRYELGFCRRARPDDRRSTVQLAPSQRQADLDVELAARIAQFGAQARISARDVGRIEVGIESDRHLLDGGDELARYSISFERAAPVGQLHRRPAARYRAEPIRSTHCRVRASHAATCTGKATTLAAAVRRSHRVAVTPSTACEHRSSSTQSSIGSSIQPASAACAFRRRRQIRRHASARRSPHRQSVRSGRYRAGARLDARRRQRRVRGHGVDRRRLQQRVADATAQRRIQALQCPPLLPLVVPDQQHQQDHRQQQKRDGAGPTRSRPAVRRPRRRAGRRCRCRPRRCARRPAPASSRRSAARPSPSRSCCG